MNNDDSDIEDFLATVDALGATGDNDSSEDEDVTVERAGSGTAQKRLPYKDLSPCLYVSIFTMAWDASGLPTGEGGMGRE